MPASSRKRARTRVPCSVCITSGWNWTPNSRGPASSTAATGVAAVRAVTAKPGGAAVQVSPCDIHTRWLLRRARQQAAGPSRGPEERSRRTRPVPVRSTVPPSSATSSWKP